MKQRHSTSAKAQAIIAKLATPALIQDLGPLAARFVLALRLIALHERVGRDPVPELAVRLGSLDIAAKALSLSQVISSTWPDNIHISRFCCHMLTHDEQTIGALIASVAERDRDAFNANLEGLIRPSRVELLWEAVLSLIVAEASAA